MASKYDKYWVSIIGDIHKGILEVANKRRGVYIDVKNITAYGKRNSWSGVVEVSSEGINREEMAHAMSLGKVLLKQNFMKDIDKKLRFKISNSLKLEIEVIDGKSSQETPIHIPKHREHIQIKKIPISLDKLINEIYSILEGLPPPFDYTYNPKDLPSNGIYFFYETTEKCKINGKIIDRIVRVGTHDADNRLRDRIYNHYNSNKNSSVFRKHVGSAIIKEDKRNVDVDKWMTQGTPTNKDVEKRITETFKNKFKFRCVPVNSEQERHYLEGRLIATLSFLKHHSDHWLGRFAKRKYIQESGLWNVDYVFDKSKVMNEKDLTLLKEKINSSSSLNQYSIVTNNRKQSDVEQNKVICFIPYCLGKYASGDIVKPEHILSAQDLPNTLENLLEGRNEMQNCIESNTPKTTALNLYNGKLYIPLFDYKNEIIKLIQSNQLRVIIISAGYGIVDALEPIHKYDAKMQGKIASNWKRAGLSNIISEIILTQNPKQVYGFFGGESDWYKSSSKYRYFFTEGLKIALKNGFNSDISGCFYNIEGGGFPDFKELKSLGKSSIEFMNSNFDDSYVKNIYENGRQYENVKIGFDKISI